MDAPSEEQNPMRLGKTLNISTLAVMLMLTSASRASSPEPPIEPQKVDVNKQSDFEVLNNWCHRFWTALSNLNEDWKNYNVSCSFRLNKNGQIDDLKIVRSAGSSTIDRAFLGSIKKLGHIKSARELKSTNRIIVHYFQKNDVRMKLEEGKKITPIGPYATIPDPKSSK